MITARVGAKLNNRVPASKLRLGLIIFMMLSVPMVMLKPYLAKKKTEEEQHEKPIVNNTSELFEYIIAHTMAKDPIRFAELTAIGTVAGFATGLLGVGGGIIM